MSLPNFKIYQVERILYIVVINVIGCLKTNARLSFFFLVFFTKFLYRFFETVLKKRHFPVCIDKTIAHFRAFFTWLYDVWSAHWCRPNGVIWFLLKTKLFGFWCRFISMAFLPYFFFHKQYIQEVSCKIFFVFF